MNLKDLLNSNKLISPKLIKFLWSFEGLFMAKYRCTVCNWVYDDAKEKAKFSDLPKEWVCPVCGAPKSAFVLLAEGQGEEKKSNIQFLRYSLIRLPNGVSNMFSAFPVLQHWA